MATATCPAALTPGVVRTTSPRRRFRVSDAMALVAATALGCAGADWYADAVLQESLGDLFRETGRLDGINEFVVAALELSLALSLVAAAWTVALLPLRLLGPRPRFRRLARQPGTAAALAVAVAALVALVPPLGMVAVSGGAVLPFGIELGLFEFQPVLPALAVLVSWSNLALTRSFRPERDWIDRVGRVLGACWIAYGLLFLVAFHWSAAQGSHCVARTIS